MAASTIAAAKTIAASWLSRAKQSNNFFESPDMIVDVCFHCWRHAQRLMNPAEIVVHVMKGDGVLQIFKLFGKRIREARKPAHRHSHRQILALNVARGNVAVIRCAADDCLASTHADRRTVASFWRILWSAVNLLKLRIVNLTAKCIFDRVKISAMAVCRQLNAIDKPRFQIVHEMISATCIALSDEPARHKLCIGIERNPRSNVASDLRLVLYRAIFFFGIHERPDFITLNALTREIAKYF